MIKSKIKYGPSRERPQHVVAVPGWGFGVRKAVEIKTTPDRVHYKIGPDLYPEGQKLEKGLTQLSFRLILSIPHRNPRQTLKK